MFRSLTSRVSAPALARAQVFSSTHAATAIPKTRAFVLRKVESQLARSFTTSSTLRATASAAASPSASSSSSSSSPSSSSSSSSSASTPAPQTVSDIVQHYGGWYPLIGLGGALALSKEWLILNEELLLATNFATMVMVLWLGVGDQITAACDEEDAAARKAVNDICDLEVDVYKTLIKSHQANIDSLEVLTALKQEYSTLVAAAIKAKDLKARAAARDAVLAKLTSLKTKEETELASYLEEVYDRATDYVRRMWPNVPASEKNQLIEYAINVVGGANTPLEPSKDPLRKLYQQYFEQKLYEKEIESSRKARK